MGPPTFIPHRPDRLRVGGRLQMLAIHDRPNYDTGANPDGDSRWRVFWVDIDDPDPADAEANPVAVLQHSELDR